MVEKYKETYDNMINNIGTSYKKAIKAMCYQCSGYDYSEVRQCVTTNCPIYVVKQNRANAPKRPAPVNAFKKQCSSEDDEQDLSEE